VTEPAVTLTDYALALECALFAALHHRREVPADGLRAWFVLFFVAASAAPLFGGTVHGFFLDERSLGHAVLWPSALLAIGVGALAGWVLGARIAFSGRAVRWVTRLAFAQLALFALVVLFFVQGFWVAVVDYLPASVFLLIALGLAYRRDRRPGPGIAAAGLALTFVAAALQQLRVSVHPLFNHNALYHVVQGLGLLLIFLGARQLIRRASSDPRG
jgi:hypothetical protein